MKIKKIFASIVACAMVLSSMAITASAAMGSKSTIDGFDGASDGTVKLLADDSDDNLYIDTTTVYGIKVTTDLSTETIEAAIADGTWYGGGIGANSNSTGWKSIEWGVSGKPIILATDGTITWLSDKPVFAESDAYKHLWIQSWGVDFNITAIDILGKDGSVVFGDSIGSTKPEAPAADDNTEGDDETATTTDDETTTTTVDTTDDTTEDLDTDEDDDDIATDDEDDTIDVEVTVDTTDDAPVADSTTVATETGNVAAAAIVSVMAIAGAAVIATKKRK